MNKHIFNDECVARQALEALRWPKGPVCVRCGGKVVPIMKEGRYRCAGCRIEFTAITDTIFQTIPLHIWMLATYAFSTSSFRESTLVTLQTKAGISPETVLYIWSEVRTAARRYKGYKRSFGKLIQREMTVTSKIPWYSRVKPRLLAAGTHQSQNTIKPSGILLTSAPSKTSVLGLNRTECLLRLLLSQTAEKEPPAEKKAGSYSACQ